MQLVANIYHCIAPYAIEPDWDDVYAPRLAGFPLNVFYAEWIQVRDVCFRSEYICCGRAVEADALSPDGRLFGPGCAPSTRKDGNIQIPRIRATLRGVRTGLQNRHDSHDSVWLSIRRTIDSHNSVRELERPNRHSTPWKTLHRFVVIARSPRTWHWTDVFDFSLLR